ncbi:MAG: hypothetical protein LBK70_02720 [Clostridiales bacterium]|jgi:transposase-like protein|nr:hypothetical protein [Clostridiales bacterium]
MKCPKCDSSDIIKSGFSIQHKQRYRCVSCNKQFVLDKDKDRLKLDKSDKVDRAEKVLGNKLAIEYNGALTDDDRLVAIYVFAVKWAREFRDHAVDLDKLMQYSDIGMHHMHDLLIGIKLSRYTVESDKVRKLINYVNS